MDVLKFAKEFKRMCHTYTETMCKGCPREKCLKCEIKELSNTGIKELINDVEKWSKEHPVKTRLQDLLEKYPNVKLSISGYPMLCCRTLGYCDECLHGCNGCKVCWNMPVEE